jgi:tungstate transport system substrate-binding protein
MRDTVSRLTLVLLTVSMAFAVAGCGSGKQELILGATTSVQDPGLLDPLVTAFEDAYDYDVKPIVGGSGQTLEQARQGEMDVIMTHSPTDEKQFITDGYGIDRTEVMQNFFLIAGPEDDPAGVKDSQSMNEAFQKIAAGEYAFISRGDNSGTHRREQSIWEAISVDPIGKSWYTESATGQGQNLLVANDRDAYTLVDSSTFTAFKDRVGVIELFRDADNPTIYSVVRLNAEKLPEVNSKGGDDWLAFLT